MHIHLSMYVFVCACACVTVNEFERFFKDIGVGMKEDEMM